jgi:hypothetical protein
VGELVHVLQIGAAVCLGVAAVGLAGLIAYRVRHGGASESQAVSPPTPVAQRPGRALPEPRPAIERPGELHLHGVSAEDIAAILSRRDQP